MVGDRGGRGFHQRCNVIWLVLNSTVRPEYQRWATGFPTSYFSCSDWRPVYREHLASVAAQPVVSSGRIILTTLFTSPTTMSPQHQSYPQTVAGQYWVGRKISKDSSGVTFEGQCSVLQPFSVLFPNLNPVIQQGRTSLTPRQSPSNSSVPISPDVSSCYRPPSLPNPQTGTSRCRNPPVGRGMSLILYPH